MTRKGRKNIYIENEIVGWRNAENGNERKNGGKNT